jgi:hypothetical protein
MQEYRVNLEGYSITATRGHSQHMEFLVYDRSAAAPAKISVLVPDAVDPDQLMERLTGRLNRLGDDYDDLDDLAQKILTNVQQIANEVAQASGKDTGGGKGWSKG